MGVVPKTWVVIPCYEEARRLEPEAFHAALESQPELGFVMVDDGSRDDTLRVLETMRERAPGRIEVLALERNSGKAEAVRQGVLRAFELGAEKSGYWDADLATPLRYIARFSEALDRENLTLVLGSRVRLLGHNIGRRELRHWVGRGFGTVAAAALGIHVYDTQCGAKLFKATPALRSAFEAPFTLGWSFDVELIARLLLREKEVGDIAVERDSTEYPLHEWVDTPGSKITARQFPRIAGELIRLYTTVRRTRKAR